MTIHNKIHNLNMAKNPKGHIPPSKKAPPESIAKHSSKAQNRVVDWTRARDGGTMEQWWTWTVEHALDETINNEAVAEQGRGVGADPGLGAVDETMQDQVAWYSRSNSDGDHLGGANGGNDHQSRRPPW